MDEKRRTATSKFLSLVLRHREEGLVRMERHHVHLSPDEGTARAVGSRRRRSMSA